MTTIQLVSDVVSEQGLPLLVDHIKLLALFGAVAVYLGAIRLWFHKLRMDALDTLHKAYAPPVTEGIAETQRPESRYKPTYLKRRLAHCVLWLQALALMDLVVLLGALVLFAATFQPLLPRTNWTGRFDGSVNGFCVVVQVLWFGLLCLSAAHVTSAIRAIRLNPTYVCPTKARAEPDPGLEFEKGFYTWLVVLVAGMLFFAV